LQAGGPVRDGGGGKEEGDNSKQTQRIEERVEGGKIASGKKRVLEKRPRGKQRTRVTEERKLIVRTKEGQRCDRLDHGIGGGGHLGEEGQNDALHDMA